MKIPRILIAASASGSGKTVISCGLMQALKKKGKRVVSGKCGPDYIDPMFHRTVLQIEAMNLDLFFYEKEQMKAMFQEHCKEAEIAVLEGVMGYYDGMGIDTEKGSSYDVARTLGAPVVLVVPCKGSALSVVAQIKGFLEFRKDSQIQGILLNRISKMLYPRMKEMIESQLKKEGHSVTVLGYVPEDPVFSLESRHLGLVTPEEIEGLEAKLEQAGDLLSETIDLEALMELAKTAPELNTSWEEPEERKPKESVRIAVARDEAFCFYYKENLQILRELGCELVSFSPLRDAALPKQIQGILLGGGYPEVYAKALSENQSMLCSIRQAIQNNMPCHAECGGFLYLHEWMKDKDQVAYQMAGVIPGECFPAGKLVRFGYVNLVANGDSRFLNQGECIKGHEFHYWDSTNNGEDVTAVKPNQKRSWTCIHIEKQLFAGFPHLAYASNREFAKRFVEMARAEGLRNNEKKEG